MKVKLIRQFKNHPAGTELDVSHRIYNYLLGLKVIARPQAPGRASPSPRSKALKEPPADKMVREEETKEASVEAEKEKEAPVVEEEKKKKSK